MYNILAEPVIRFNQRGGSTQRASLPQVYAALAADEAQSFPALRPHQRHAWHAFLVQLAVIAIRNSGHTEMPRTPEDWAQALRDLTPGHDQDQPWHLVQEELTTPAFLQPPASSPERQKDYRFQLQSPTELDVLIASKNHEPKRFTDGPGEIDDWVFALVTLQTMEGYSAPGNYGISRMNKGLGSRPTFALAPATPGHHLVHDVSTILDNSDTIAADVPMRPGGAALLWTLPWDGQKSEMLAPEDLDPFYIDVCRRVRLHLQGQNGLCATTATSRGNRVNAKDLTGRTGDPWTPVNTAEKKSLTMAPGGFLYYRIIDYLTSPKWKKPVLLQVAPTDGQVNLIAQAMVRRMGKTHGYFDRTIPIRQPTLRSLEQGYEEFASLATERNEQVKTVQGILRHAIKTYIDRGNTSGHTNNHTKMAEPTVQHFNQAVDAYFFQHLQDEIELDSQDERREKNLEWQRWLMDEAQTTLDLATRSLPTPIIFRYRAKARANNLFQGRMRSKNGLPDLFDTPPEDQGEGNGSGPPPKQPENRPPQVETLPISGVIASEHFDREDLLELRAMDPDNPRGKVFDRLMLRQDLPRSHESDPRWGLIIHGIAVMTSTDSQDRDFRVAHHRLTPVGQALFLGNDYKRRSPFYTEHQLNQMLNAQGPMLRTVLIRMFRLLASVHMTFNWKEMADLVLSEGIDDQAAEDARDRIARDYYQVERRNNTQPAVPDN